MEVDSFPGQDLGQVERRFGNGGRSGSGGYLGMRTGTGGHRRGHPGLASRVDGCLGALQLWGHVNANDTG